MLQVRVTVKHNPNDPAEEQRRQGESAKPVGAAQQHVAASQGRFDKALTVHEGFPSLRAAVTISRFEDTRSCRMRLAISATAFIG
ncbi:MAG: hypothetical protein ACYC3I_08630 [Gemmataceae bacterium]